MSILGSKIKRDELFKKNEAAFRSLLNSNDSKAAEIRQGGGPEAVSRHHGRGKLTARERIAKLIDPGSDFLEIGLFSAYGMYEEFGGLHLQEQ